MKIYRVHLCDESGMSLGYEYYSNKKDANDSIARQNKNNSLTSLTKSDIEEKEVVIGKYEFLKLLNNLASHPDNG